MNVQFNFRYFQANLVVDSFLESLLSGLTMVDFYPILSKACGNVTAENQTQGMDR